MGLIDWIQNLFKDNKKLTANLHVQELIKNYGDKTPLEIGLFDGKIRLNGRDVHFYLIGVDYTRVTDT